MRTSVMLAACVGAAVVLPAQAPRRSTRNCSARSRLPTTWITRRALPSLDRRSRAEREPCAPRARLHHLARHPVPARRGHDRPLSWRHYRGAGLTAEAAADLDAEFKREVTQAIALAQAERRRDSRNLQALEDLGAAQGLQATYTASVEGSVMAAFSSAKGAFDAAETLLDRNPRNVTATTLVGTYRYAVATLSLPSRMFAYVADWRRQGQGHQHAGSGEPVRGEHACRGVHGPGPDLQPRGPSSGCVPGPRRVGQGVSAESPFRARAGLGSHPRRTPCRGRGHSFRGPRRPGPRHPATHPGRERAVAV